MDSKRQHLNTPANYTAGTTTYPAASQMEQGATEHLLGAHAPSHFAPSIHGPIHNTTSIQGSNNVGSSHTLTNIHGGNHGVTSIHGASELTGLLTGTIKHPMSSQGKFK
jgi:hypothetical protein